MVTDQGGRMVYSLPSSIRQALSTGRGASGFWNVFTCPGSPVSSRDEPLLQDFLARDGSECLQHIVIGRPLLYAVMVCQQRLAVH